MNPTDTTAINPKRNEPKVRVMTPDPTRPEPLYRPIHAPGKNQVVDEEAVLSRR